MPDGVDRHPESEIPNFDLENLKVVSAVGRGAKGVVFLVRTESGELLALKTILRESIEKKSKENRNQADGSDYKRISFERQVLNSLQHPLLPKLRGDVSTEKIVGYLIDYCPGGDLNSLRKKQTEKMFSIDIIRFYAAEMVLALEYLHGLGIVYRDLKPENVMIQENGHLMLVDFDLSTKLAPKSPKTPSPNYPDRKTNPVKKKKFTLFHHCCSSGVLLADSVYPAELGGDSVSSESDSVEKSNSFVGTEEYVAPEIIIGNGHDFAVDWWCLGVILYEMLYGTTPFRGTNRKETFYRVLSKEPELTGEPTPLRDLIKKLLEKDPKKRISLEEIKGHEFFKNINWDFLVEIQRPPYIPAVSAVEVMEGNNKEIDVESFVQGVFLDKVGDEGLVANSEKIEDKNRNNGVWVQGLNNPTQAQNDNFLIF